MVQLNFDARSVAPSAGFIAIPSGWYKVVIDESGPMKPTKSGNGSFLPIRFSVLEGQYKNQKLFVRLNLDNPSQQAKEIAYGELSAIGHAVGVLQIDQSEQLHNKPLWVKVKVRSGAKNEQTGETYDDSNEIQSYKDINFVPPNSGSTPVATTGPVIPPVMASPPAIPPVAASAPAPVATPTYQMAAGETFTREQYHAAGWSDETLIAQGKMVAVAPAPVAPPAAPPAPVAPPTAPLAPPAAPTAVGDMPWANAPQQPWAAPTPANTSTPTGLVTPPPPAAVAAQSAAPPWSQPKA